MEEINKIKEDWYTFIKKFSMSNYYVVNPVDGMLDLIDVCTYGLSKENHKNIKELNDLISSINMTYIQIFKNNSDLTDEINNKFKEVNNQINQIKLTLR
jgi:hypothetical protein